MDTLDWLIDSPEPWTGYRVLLDLLDQPTSSPEVISAREAMTAHPLVRELVKKASTWEETPLKRHNDASHPLYALSVLADFGLTQDDPGMAAVVSHVMAHRSPEGIPQSLINIPSAFGGSNADTWTWMLCDAPTVLSCLLAFGLGNEPSIQNSIEYLAGLAYENGWRCQCAPENGKFHGPGKRSDPCPIANVYMLRTLSLVPAACLDKPAVRAGVEMVLSHWAEPDHPKPYLFGVGTDFRKVKYPLVWYDILNVCDTLSRIPLARADPRFRSMVDALSAAIDSAGRVTAGSMYLSWKGWSFANKKEPSPWLTFLVLRVLRRVGIRA